MFSFLLQINGQQSHSRVGLTCYRRPGAKVSCWALTFLPPPPKNIHHMRITKDEIFRVGLKVRFMLCFNAAYCLLKYSNYCHIANTAFCVTIALSSFRWNLQLNPRHPYSKRYSGKYTYFRGRTKNAQKVIPVMC